MIPVIDSVITLVKKTYGRNAAGGIVVTETTRDVFCSVDSVRRNDFFEAAQIGMDLQFVFKTNPVNYDGEDTLIYEGMRYGIQRTYFASNDVIELYAGLVVGENRESANGSNSSGQ